MGDLANRASRYPNDWGRFGLGLAYGAAGGVTLAGIVGLAHEISLARRQRKLLKPPSETDEDTIVLTLPPKHADILRSYAYLLDYPEREQPAEKTASAGDMLPDGNIFSLPAKLAFLGLSASEDLASASEAEKAAAVSGTPAQEPVRAGARAPATTSHTRVPVKSVRKPNCGGTAMKVAVCPNLVLASEKRGSVDDVLGHGIPSLSTWVLSTAAIPAAGLGAYKLTRYLHQQAIERRLKRQEEAARQELLDAMGTDKVAGWLDDLIPDPSVKEAQGAPAPAPAQPGGFWNSGPVQGFLRAIEPPQSELSPTAKRTTNAIFGPMGVLALLGTAGTAWLTKRILDAKAEERDRAGWNPPKVKRIVFRSSPVRGPEDLEPGEEQLSEDEVQGVKAAYVLMLDRLSGRSEILNVPEIRAELEKAGMTPEQGYEAAMTESVVKSAQFSMPKGVFPGADMAFAGGPESPLVPPEVLNNFMRMVTGNDRLKKMIIGAGVSQSPALHAFSWNDAGAAPYYPMAEAAKSMAPDALIGAAKPKLEDWFRQQWAKAGPVGRPFLKALASPEVLNYLENATVQGPGLGPRAQVPANPGLMDNLERGMKQMFPEQVPNWSVNLKPILQKAWPLLAGAGATWLARRAGARGPLSYLPLAAGMGGAAYNTRDMWRPGAYKAWKGVQSFFNKPPASAEAFFAKLAEDPGVVDKLLAMAGGVPAETPAETPPADPMPPLMSQVRRRARRVRVQAGDPAADAFVRQNRRRIGKLLVALVDEGKLQPA